MNAFQLWLCQLVLLYSWQAGFPLSAQEFPGETWRRVSAEDAGPDPQQLQATREYALSGGGSGYITRGGRLVLSWGDPTRRYDLKSTTKSFGATALGVALLDGRMSLADRVAQHHPNFGTPPESNAQTGWLDRITILHLATQTAGFEKPGGYQKLMFEPGTQWAYSDGGPNWLAECITLAYRQDIDVFMSDRVFTPLGITRDDLVWRNNSYRDRTIAGIPRREFGSGISANVDAMARLGLLYLRDGLWKETRILPEDFARQAGSTVKAVAGLPVVNPPEYGKASDHYGLLWWNNADGTLPDVPRDAYWSWGLYGSLIVVIPSLDIVVARAGQTWKRERGEDHYAVLQPFPGPIAAAADDVPEREPPPKPKATAAATHDAPPCPRSSVIAEVVWSPVESITRRARGSDNWPLTWVADDQLYTVYGDGRGFELFVDRRLSLGLVRIDGPAEAYTAVNLRSAALEATGDGAQGKKESGLLMVHGTLYLWARNAGNSQLAWSTDLGRNWTWSDWKFSDGFGAPTFLNYGPDYSGARDDYVYVYSHDHDSAHEAADRMVLARVPRQQITQRTAWEFFLEVGNSGQARWTADVAERGSVFDHRGRCYRSGISYNPGLKRYL